MQGAQEAAFWPVQPDGRASRGCCEALQARLSSVMDSVITPQQRIGQLEQQNRRLSKEVQMWKNTLRSFAYEELRAFKLG